jgi:uncharacterized protein (TIGR02246 family)
MSNERDESQVRRSPFFVAFLTVCLAIPAVAQKPSEQQIRPAIERLLETWDTAANRKDAAAIASLYTEDAVRVTPRGISYGRAAIEKDLVETFKVTSNIADKVEKVQVVGEVVLVTATWSATLQSNDGPIQARGSWGGVYVRDGDAWKTRLAVINRALPPPK